MPETSVPASAPVPSQPVLPRLVHPAAGPLLVMLYALAVLAPVLLSTLAVSVDPDKTNLLRMAGRHAALTGAAILVLQPVLAARFGWIERPFGLDRLLRFHRAMAVAAVCLLALHPVLIAAGWRWSLLYDPAAPWSIWLGKINFALLVLGAAAGVFFSRLPLRFERWRGMHAVMAGLVLSLLAAHALALGRDVAPGPLVVLLPAAVLAGLWALAHNRWLRPRRLAREPWTVRAVGDEAEGVRTVRLEPPDGLTAFAHEPGQFHFLTFVTGALPREEHHFTIASSPVDTDARSSTIKASGDFTARLDQAKPGDRVAVHGPFGAFSHLRHLDEGDLAFVSGGIGITPLMSMLRCMRDTGDGRRVLLVCANRSAGDIVFREELEAMAGGDAPRLELVHVLSEPDDARPDGETPEGVRVETGHVDADLLARLVDDPADRGWYLCGPRDMVTGLRRALADMGVPRGRVHWELFDFLARGWSTDTPALRRLAVWLPVGAAVVGAVLAWLRLP